MLDVDSSRIKIRGLANCSREGEQLHYTEARADEDHKAPHQQHQRSEQL
jgi:hypothetical protein